MARRSQPKSSNKGRAVSGNSPTMVASASTYRPGRGRNVKTDRNQIAKPWQVEVYRHLNICGEARYAVTLFAAMAGRAEIGVSEPNALNRKAVWVENGPEVDVFATLAPTVRDRSRLVRDYMTHIAAAGECYLINRAPKENDPDYDERIASGDGVWEIVAVTELRHAGMHPSGAQKWQVRIDNNNWVDLGEFEPVIRMWVPDPSDRMEAWAPMRSLLPTLREIEWLTKHIFTQVRSRLMSAGVWFLPNNLTYPDPPSDASPGGQDALAAMNDAERFMLSLASSAMDLLEDDEVSIPSIVMADPLALEQIDKGKLIQFWSEIDDKAMVLRSDAVRRFALGMDMPPEQILGSSGLAVTGAGGSAGSVNHWGVWANEEQTISAHIEPALDIFVTSLTDSILRPAVPGTKKVVAYDTTSLRLKQDRSKEAMEWYDRGGLKMSVALREAGFDPENDMMTDDEFRRWLLTKIAGGSATPEQVQESLRLLGVVLDIPLSPTGEAAPSQPGRNNPPSLKNFPVKGPPQEQHDHSPAPFSATEATAEVLVLRALEKAGNRLLNDGKRGRSKDRETPPHLAHVASGGCEPPEFDFSLSSTVFGDLPAAQREESERQLNNLCADLYRTGTPYTRDRLIESFRRTE